MKKSVAIVAITAFVFAVLVLAPEPAGAQQAKKGQSAKVQLGVVVKSERVNLSENKAPAGALVGGTISWPHISFAISAEVVSAGRSTRPATLGATTNSASALSYSCRHQ